MMTAQDDKRYSYMTLLNFMLLNRQHNYPSVSKNTLYHRLRLPEFSTFYYHSSCIHLNITSKCSKLRVHPAPGVHDFATGCTILKAVHPVCAPSFGNILYIQVKLHLILDQDTWLCRVMHPGDAQM